MGGPRKGTGTNPKETLQPDWLFKHYLAGFAPCPLRYYGHAPGS